MLGRSQGRQGNPSLLEQGSIGTHHSKGSISYEITQYYSCPKPSLIYKLLIYMINIISIIYITHIIYINYIIYIVNIINNINIIYII